MGAPSRLALGNMARQPIGHRPCISRHLTNMVRKTRIGTPAATPAVPVGSVGSRRGWMTVLQVREVNSGAARRGVREEILNPPSAGRPIWCYSGAWIVGAGQCTSVERLTIVVRAFTAPGGLSAR